MRRISLLLVCFLLLVSCFSGLVDIARADDALVLPKGRFRALVDDYIFLPIGERYSPQGHPEGLASQFENRRLDSTVFSLLTPLNAFVGNASIGESNVSFKYYLNSLALGVQYGLTDRLTVGLRIPYWWARNRVKVRINSESGSSANVGVNTGAAIPITAGTAVLPLTLPGVRRFTTEDIQQLLGPGLAVGPSVRIPGFGFKRVESWSGEGLGDIEAGARYQYLRTDDWRLAVTAGVRFPTGRQDDPDDLTDFPFGMGAYALLARLHADYTLSNLWKTAATRGTPALPRTGDLILNGTLRYDWVLAQKVTKRIPNDVNNPLTTNRERVRLDTGDKFEFEASGTYYVLDSLSLSALYRYGFKLEDTVSGHRNLAYHTLEQDTDAKEHLYIVGLTYSTLPLYRERRFLLPLAVSLAYRDRFAGSGPRTPYAQVLKSRYINLGLQILF
ncbi:MAG TPA: hypothetical protein VIH59_07960 [Candidatus Tectomicrobia bacterium]|jgi:hypothetical protein